MILTTPLNPSRHRGPASPEALIAAQIANTPSTIA